MALVSTPLEFLDVLRLLAFCQVREISFECVVKGFLSFFRDKLVMHIRRILKGISLIWAALCYKVINVYVSWDFRCGSCKYVS